MSREDQDPILEQHLRLVEASDSDPADLEKTYDPDVVVLTDWGTFRGLDGLRENREVLRRRLGALGRPGRQVSQGPTVHMEWTPKTADQEALFNTVLIRDGRICAQTFGFQSAVSA